jgi:hypothetical protein
MQTPSIRRIVATDGHVAFLAGCGLGFAAVIAALVGLTQPSSPWRHWFAVAAPLVMLLPPALLWAWAIRSAFGNGREVPGRIVGRRRDLRGLLVVEFSYRLEGKERHGANHFLPRSSASRLEPGASVTVVAPRHWFPGPIIKEAYG